VEPQTWFKYIGFRKIWEFGGGEGTAFDYQTLVNDASNYSGMAMNRGNFSLQLLNCLMICVISL